MYVGVLLSGHLQTVRIHGTY